MAGRVGNHCGHDPACPALGTHRIYPKGPGGLPLVLHKAVERLRGFYWRPALLPSLNLANGSTRQQRSERREACIQTLSTILYHLNLTTLCVGIPTPEQFVHLPLSTLGRQTTLGEKRIYRALRDLKQAGILTIAQPRCKTPGGRWIGQVAVKAVSRAFFRALGLGTMLYRARKHAARKHRTQGFKSPGSTCQGQVALWMKAIRKKRPAMPTPRRPMPTKDPPKEDLAASLRKIEAIRRQQALKD